MSTPRPPQADPRPRRRWLRVSLRGLMALVLILAYGLGWIIHSARVQREAVAAIERTGGQADYRWTALVEFFPAKTLRQRLILWSARTFGPDSFDPIVRVSLGAQAGDAEMAHVARLSAVTSFRDTRSAVTDVGLARLGDLPRLGAISLEGPSNDPGSGSIRYGYGVRPLPPGRITPQVTGAFLHGLRRASGLEDLHLGGVPVRDADLAGLAHLTSLKNLDLASTGITDAGMVHLRGLTGLRSLVLSDNLNITSVGLEHLRGLAGLVNLDLTRTRVGDLRPLASLTGCWNIKLADTPVTDADLAPLAGVTHLMNLYLPGTAVTGTGLAPLQALGELQLVDLEGAKVTDAGVAALWQLPRLSWLNLARTGMTDAALDRLAGSGSLQALDVSETAVTDAGIVRLLGAVPLQGVNLEAARLNPARRAGLLTARPSLTLNGYTIR